jgi:hypothetical protein
VCQRASQATFQDFNEFFQDFYTKLKADSDFIPFLFVTGSSCLAIKGFFTGPNDITDLSYELEAATALGYTWNEIERLYGEQLVLLDKLYGSRDIVKTTMEEWYNKYRWSKNSSGCVFNPLSVNMFMKSGEFLAHWTETGEPSLLFNKNLFEGDVMRLLLGKDGSKDAFVALTLEQLKGIGGDMKLKPQLSGVAQLSLLVSSGVLTLSPECNANSSTLSLIIPNVESRAQAEMILQSTRFICD